MYLKEYLTLRGVNANALTSAEAQVIGIDATKKGWAKINGNVEIPTPLAAAASRGAKRDELKALANSLRNKYTPEEKPAPLVTWAADEAKKQPPRQVDGFQHEAMDRCHVVLSMIEAHLLSHPYMEVNPAVQREVQDAVDALARAYQMIGARP